MKKLLLIAPIALASQLAYGDTIYLANSGTNLTQATPAASGGVYYKCTNSVTYSCQTTSIEVSYTSKTSSGGTYSNPYILTNCSFIRCINLETETKCAYNEYLSGTSCTICPFDAMVSKDTSFTHTQSGWESCIYCPSNMIKDIYNAAPGYRYTRCSTCPENGTCDGSETVVCKNTYYGTTSCEPCPKSPDVAPPAGYKQIPGSTQKGSTNITDCYLSKGYPFSGNHGEYSFTENCHYKN